MLKKPKEFYEFVLELKQVLFEAKFEKKDIAVLVAMLHQQIKSWNFPDELNYISSLYTLAKDYY